MTSAPTRRAFLALVGAAATAPAQAAPIPAEAALPAPVPAPPPPEAWMPADYQDDIIYHTTGSPSEWLVQRGSGHVLVSYHGDEPDDDAVLLRDGEVIEFDHTTKHGTGTLTVHRWTGDDDAPDDWQPWTLDPPMPQAPSGMVMHLCQDDDVENSGVDPAEVADYLDPGTYTVRFYAWNWRSRRFRYDAAAGALVPMPAKGGGG